VLKRKPRKRYLWIRHTGASNTAIDALGIRLLELFGSLALERAALRLIRTEDGVMIVRCNLSEIHSILVTIALVDPPMVSFGISGSIRRLAGR
jgi:hypothetical protein